MTPTKTKLPTNTPELAEHVRRYRIHKGLSLAALARRVGVSPYVIWAVEKGHQINMASRKKIVDLVGEPQ